MQDEILRRKAFVNISCVGGAIALFVIFFNLIKGQSDVAINTAFLLTAITLNFIIFYTTKNVTIHTLIGIICFLVYILTAAQSLGGQIYFWIYVLPWISFFLLGLQVGTLIVFLSMLVFASVLHFLPPHFIEYHGSTDITLSFLLVSVTIFSYELTKTRYSKELQLLSYLDPLTNTWNRRKFEDTFNLELARAKRYKRPFTLIMFDIDYFKPINDQHGHPAGDAILQRLAELVQHNIRITDFLFRWGGEEFLILAPETSVAPGGKELAEKIRHTIEEAKFPTVDHLTISLGVTEINLTDTLDNLIQKADEALYQAKHNGRNRVEVMK